MYEQTTVRVGFWPMVGPVFLAGLIGSFISAVILVGVAPLISGAPAGYEVFVPSSSAQSAWGVIVIACNSLAAGLVLRPLLHRMIGLEISPGGAIVAFLLGGMAGAVLIALLQPGSSATSTFPTLSSITPLLLLGTIALEVVVAQTFATPTTRQNAIRRPSALPLLPLVLVVVVLVPAVARLTSLPQQLNLSTPGDTTSSQADDQRVAAQMMQTLQGFNRAARTSKTVARVNCSHTTGQPPGFGHNAAFTYYSCVAIYTNSQQTQLCAAYDGNQVGTYYAGPRGCKGQSYPATSP